MVDVNNDSATEAANEGKMHIHMDPNIEFKYRDLFNLHISAEDVVIELGNVQRGVAAKGAIKDVIVMSPANAIRLQKGLAQAIENMQQKIREYQSREQSK